MASNPPVDGYEFGPDATQRATESALARCGEAHVAILVEGISDQIAVEAVALRLGRDLDADRIVVAPIGGAHAITRVVGDLRRHPHLELRGLVDELEAPEYDAVLDRVHVCRPDLEHELIRSHDAAAIETLLDDRGDLASLRTMQKQPAWSDRPFVDQIHRWLRSISHRGPTYAKALIEAADVDRLPPPLVALFDEP